MESFRISFPLRQATLVGVRCKSTYISALGPGATIVLLFANEHVLLQADKYGLKDTLHALWTFQKSCFGLNRLKNRSEQVIRLAVVGRAHRIFYLDGRHLQLLNIINKYNQTIPLYQKSVF